MNASAIDQIPYLGAGLGHRREIHDDILQAREEVDFLEIITEKYISAPPRMLNALARLADNFTLIPHGVSLSVGTASPVSKTFLRGLREICDIVRPPYYSDHLAVTQTAGIDLGHLAPLAYNTTSLRHVIDNINRVQDYLGLPFVLENITETHAIPGADMDGAEFMARVLDRTDCGLLLDITNLYTNSVNLQFDPLAHARCLPLHRVVQVHLAGGFWEDGVLIDSHSEPVPMRVWELFEQLRPSMPVKAALVERDANYPDFEELLREVGLARRYLDAGAAANEAAA